MKVGPLTKLVNRNKKISKKIDDSVKSANCEVVAIFQFMTNLEHSGSQITNAYSVRVTFSLRTTFYLKILKTELGKL